MKKIYTIFGLLLIATFVIPSFAAKNSSAGSPTPQTIRKSTVTPTGNVVQNRNQVKTLNQGEDSQLKINTQEQESLGQNRGLGSENMSQVATQVQELQQIRTKGGIGDQVRQIAHDQNEAQSKIQQQLSKLDSKGKLSRLLTGTDLEAVDGLQEQLTENELRIEQLTQLKTQLTNQGDIAMVEATIQALVDENEGLGTRIASETKTKSMFGWLFRLLQN